MSDSIHANTSDGRRIIIRKRGCRLTKNCTNVSSHAREPLLGLSESALNKHYGIDIHRLLDNIQLNNIEQNHQKDKLYAQPQTVFETTSTSQTNQKNKSFEKVPWSEKYRAKMYKDLVGDERTHRDVLRWLKSWDQCVFGRMNKAGNSSTKAPLPDLIVPADPLGRPQKKLLLIAGPPGLGKTTLANVAARQCGYEVVEMNASDERTGSSVRDRVWEILSNRTVVGSKARCLILDEIDGVWNGGGEGGFVRELVNLIVAEEKSQKYQSKKNQKKRKKREVKQIQRPIICICNDPFATVLRPLRPYVEIVYMKKPPISSMVNRLTKICKEENHQSDLRTLTLLANTMGGDMRSALNALQFICTNNETVSQESVRGQNSAMGLKDSVVSSTDVVEHVFAQEIGKNVEEASAASIMHLVETNGDYDRVASGCHAHFLTQSFNDNMMTKRVQGYDWLYLHDYFYSSIYSKQFGELEQYLSVVSGAFWALFSSPKKTRKLERNMQAKEMFDKEKIYKELLHDWHSCMRCRLKQNFPPNSLSWEGASFFLRIISPPIRSASSQLLATNDKLMVRRAVDAMCDIGLSYSQHRVEDGSFVFRLEP